MATSRFPTNTDDAVERFSPGQKILLKPLDGCPEVSFTCIVSIPDKNSITVVAKADVGDSEQVLIEIYDLRYLDERIAEKPCCKSHPWTLANEQAAAMARTENSHLSNQELRQILHSHRAEELSGEHLATHNILWEEYCYRLVMEPYELNLRVLELLKDHQGSASPHLVMAGKFLPPDERAVRPPAIVTRYGYVPSAQTAFSPDADGGYTTALPLWQFGPIYDLEPWTISRCR